VGGLEKKGIGAKTLCHTRICIIKFEIEPNFEKKTVLFLFASSKKSEKSRISGSTSSIGQANTPYHHISKSNSFIARRSTNGLNY
jgi:hypothetical protein